MPADVKAPWISKREGGKQELKMDEFRLYKVEPEYIKHLHKVDNRVSKKYCTRPFVGIVTMPNGTRYFLPLTSQTTKMRLAEGKKKRALSLTTFIRDSSGNEIASILHNNMIPVIDGAYTVMDITAEKDVYESNEIRFIRKKHDQIIRKAKNVYEKRISGEDPFYNALCCDYEKLEKVSLKFKKRPTSRSL